MSKRPDDAESNMGTDTDKSRKEKEGSWVWRWAEKRTATDNSKWIHCQLKGCKKKYVLVTSSTSNIAKHLKNDHKLNESSAKDGTNSSQPGSIESALSNHGKRSAAHFSVDAFEEQVCKMLILHKLPFTLVQSAMLKELLELAHAAPSLDVLKLPSNKTIARRVSKFLLYCNCWRA